MDEVMDILNKWEIFFGQRSGRQIWAAKSLWAQEEDIKNFNRDLKKVKEEILTLRNSVNELPNRRPFAVIKYKGLVHGRVLESLKEEIKEEIERDGFVLVDDRFDVFVVGGTKGES